MKVPMYYYYYQAVFTPSWLSHTFALTTLIFHFSSFFFGEKKNQGLVKRLV